MTFLRRSGEAFNEKLQKLMNAVVKEAFGSLDSITNIDSDQMEGLTAVNESLTSFYELVEEHCAAMDEMSSKLDSIQNELRVLKHDINDIKEKAE